MSHPAVEDARRLLRPAHRREEGKFLAEGPHVVKDALGAAADVETIFVAHDRAEDASVAPLVEAAAFRGARVLRIAAKDLARIADTDTPQGVIAVVRRAPEPLAPFAVPGAWLFLDGVQDPGNVGTLLRSAEAFGARGVIAFPGTADLWSGKVMRAAQGAHFRLTLLEAAPSALAERLDSFDAHGGAIWVADTAGNPLWDAPPRPPLFAVALGNEARGVSDDVRRRAARVVTVPQAGRAESLNVAMAGTVLLSWLLRSPRGGQGR